MAAVFIKKNEPNEIKENKNETSFSISVRNKIEPLNFNIFDLGVIILSIFSIIIDLCTDLVLVVQYSNQGYKAWAIGTFVLIFLPSIIVQFFSLRWHIVDKTASALHWVLHFCMLGIIHRYVQVIKAAFAAYKSKKSSDIQKVLFDQSDLCMLHLFESFLESAPQLVLQIYIIALLHEWRFWTGVSVLASLLSLAWALAAYTKAQRKARINKNSTTWPGLLLQAIWRTGMLTSRISTLVLGAYCFGSYIFLIITIHWIAMTVWVIYQKTDFCETYWEEKIYNAVVGVIYCFCFFNLREGQSRWRALAFYLVIVFQNLTCLTIFLMWFGEKAPKLAVSGFVAIIGGTIIGSTSMLFYYRFFHPSGAIKFIFSPQPSQAVDSSPFYSTMTLRLLKQIRCESPSDVTQRNSPKTESKETLSKNSFSDSIIIVEENISNDTDVDIKILQDWINEVNDKKTNSLLSNKNGKKETEAEAYKRRAICSAVDLVKLIESKAESENGNLKLIGMDETSSEILSAHDYENLCAVNIAREAWGLRSWRGYFDIETWLHDDSIVHDRRLDTLTSTNSSDHSVSTLQKDCERTRQDDYMDAIAEDLAQCELEASSDDVVCQHSIESLPVTYNLGTLDPVFEKIEITHTDCVESSDLKIRNSYPSTLVATIDEIRRSTPIQNRYQPSEIIYHGLSPLSDVKPKLQKNWKKVTFASQLLTFPDDSEPSSETRNKIRQEKIKTENMTVENAKSTKIREQISFKTKKNEVYIPVKKSSDSGYKGNSKIQNTYNKENIFTVASKINHWNKILSLQNEKNEAKKIKITPPKKGYVSEKKSLFLLRVLTPPNFPTFQRKKDSL